MTKRVEGLIEFDMGVFLYETVLKIKNRTSPIVEVGAFKGLSTVYLSRAAKATGKRVKSFELFSGLPTADPNLDQNYHVGDLSSDRNEYEANVRTFGARDVVDLVIGDARTTMLPSLSNSGFSVAFLDVDVYIVTKELLFQLWSQVNGGEVIIIHNVNDPGVRKAIDEFHILSRNVVKEQIIMHGIAAVLHIPVNPAK